jgi:molybdopterin-binding protein
LPWTPSSPCLWFFHQLSWGSMCLFRSGRRSPLGRLYREATGDTLPFSFKGLLLASVLYSLPFAVQPFASAFGSVDQRLIEASRCLGSSSWNTFRRIIVPLSLPGVVTGMILSFAHTLGVVVHVDAGPARVLVGPTEVCSVVLEELREREAVLVCIRAEDVTLQRDKRDIESARNHLAGTIQSIESDGAVERISPDCGFSLVAIITRTSREDMGLGIGTSVTAAIKASAIHT